MSSITTFLYGTTPTRDEIAKFCILCAMEVCEDPEFLDWAKRWLGGENRNPETASRVGLRMVRHDDSQQAGFWATRAATRMDENNNSWAITHDLQDVVDCANRARRQKVAAEAKQWSPEGWQEVLRVWHKDRQIDFKKLIEAALK